MTVSVWTEDRVGRLKTLWREGKTADQIAQDLAHGITRSAVLGKVYRLGLSSQRSPRPPKTASPRNAARICRRIVTAAKPVVAPIAPRASAKPGLATLLSVRRSQCRWPLGDPLEVGFTLCGRTIVRGAYCGGHAEIAYRPARDTPQTLERLAGLA